MLDQKGKKKYFDITLFQFYFGILLFWMKFGGGPVKKPLFIGPSKIFDIDLDFVIYVLHILDQKFR